MTLSVERFSKVNVHYDDVSFRMSECLMIMLMWKREKRAKIFPQVRRTSEGSGGDADHLHRSVSPHIVEDHLAASSIGEDNHALQFEVNSSLSTGCFFKCPQMTPLPSPSS